MQGSLALHKGTLFVGRYEKTAHVTVYDLDGHRLPGGFSFRDEAVGRSSVSGISVDEDRRIWIADAPGGRVRRFTLFGAEVGVLGRGEPSSQERPGSLGRPVDICAEGDADEGRLLVASGGERRYGLHLFDGAGGFSRALRALGDPDARFQGLAGASLCERFAYTAEVQAQRIQVFRDGEFHFAFSVPCRQGAFEPTAVAPLRDRRMVLAVRGPASALLLVDSAGQLLGCLAEAGIGEGRVENPSDVVVQEGAEDRETQVLVIDRDGFRVQVFNLEGRCYGSFLEGDVASSGSE